MAAKFVIVVSILFAGCSASLLDDASSKLLKVLGKPLYDGPKLPKIHLPAEIAPDVKEAIKRNLTQTIEYFGYPVEVHKVTTTDWYVLTLFRIPHGRNSKEVGKKVAFLQHGLIDTSFTWLYNFPHQSLPYILADRGYDVWLGNIRGNTYSTEGADISTKERAFWDFTYEEMSQNDLPAMLHYVLDKTGVESLTYIGHSQGGAMGFLGFSLNPSIARRVKLFVALAPATNVAHLRGGMRLLAPFSAELNDFFEIFFHGEFVVTQHTVVNKWLGQLLCGPETTEWICQCAIFLVAGMPHHTNETRLPFIVANSPGGTSSKNFDHYGQTVSTKRWTYYDYGWARNLGKYGSTTPPDYDIDMDVPTALFYSDNDWLVTTEDIESYLIPKIKNRVATYHYKDYSHLDFTWANDELTDEVSVYRDVLDVLAKYDP